MSDLVGNPEDRFSRVAAHIVGICSNRGHNICAGFRHYFLVG